MQYYDIDLRGEPKKKISSKDCEIHVGAAGKNMGIYKDKDGIFKHRDAAPSSAPPKPEGGDTNEVIYNKMCSLETLVTTGFRELWFEITFLKNQKQAEDSDESEDEEMDEDESD